MQQVGRQGGSQNSEISITSQFTVYKRAWLLRTQPVSGFARETRVWHGFGEIYRHKAARSPGNERYSETVNNEKHPVKPPLETSLLME